MKLNTMKDVFLFLLIPFAVIMVAFAIKRKKIASYYEDVKERNPLELSTINATPENIIIQQQSADIETEKKRQNAKDSKDDLWTTAFWVIVVLGYLFRSFLAEVINSFMVYLEYEPLF